ncbi:caspase family protein [Streptomyces sp. NBC_00878]|uniref:caspase family protein n=1 Tax=Streptomyces sp. NBC_00878 TaxID=2975854 RepID=UPI00224F4018|nr:caspase family protein [Streptomyces sp. NBC_00878]MCX4902977.1 caspase family protein [Streptomyces sp. NBC_00878]
MSFPSREGSHAVLIGIDSYQNLTPLGPVKSGVLRLAEVLQSPLSWQLASSNITMLDSEAGGRDVLTAIKNASLAATDTLLVYFAGHGQRDTGGQHLYLALKEADRDHPYIGGIKYDDVKRALYAGNRIKRRVVILDCCFSGLAGAMSGGRSDTVSFSDLADVEIEGSYVLTSAAANKVSLALEGESYPKFTGELISLLEEGIAGAGPTVTLDELWLTARRRMELRGLPRPERFAQNTSGLLSIAKNIAHSGSEKGAAHSIAIEESTQGELSPFDALRLRRGIPLSRSSGSRVNQAPTYDERNPSWLVHKVPKLKDPLDPSLARAVAVDTLERGTGPVLHSEVVVRYLHLNASDPDGFLDELIRALDRLAEALVDANRVMEAVAAKREANKFRTRARRET